MGLLIGLALSPCVLIGALLALLLVCALCTKRTEITPDYDNELTQAFIKRLLESK